MCTSNPDYAFIDSLLKKHFAQFSIEMMQIAAIWGAALLFLGVIVIAALR